MNLRIDPEFRNLIPPLSEDERQQLEENLRRDGCRDALAVWGDVIVDGHHRYEICTRLAIPFDVIRLEFESREAAADWIDANQLGRRNLTPDQMHLLRGRRYNRAKKAHGGDRRSDDFSSPQSEDLVKTSGKLAAQYGVSHATIERDGQFAWSVESLRSIVPDIEARVMTGEIPSRQSVVDAAKQLKFCEVCGHWWLEDMQQCPYCTKTPEARIEFLRKETERILPHVAYNAGNSEWYTPPELIEAARKVLGSIDLDPASTERANEVVNADQIFTSEDDGLTKDWAGNVWMNPPYSTGLIEKFSDKLIQHYLAGDVTGAIVLVNNATETHWFQELGEHAACICFPKGRVRFWSPGENRGTPLQGQAILYLGKRVMRFHYSFREFGFLIFAAAR